METQHIPTYVEITKDEMQRLAEPIVAALNAQLRDGVPAHKHPLVLCSILAQSLARIDAFIDLNAPVELALPPFAVAYRQQVEARAKQLAEQAAKMKTIMAARPE